MEISEFQQMIERIYGARDRGRGSAATFRWFTEEVGELARAMRKTEAAGAEGAEGKVRANLEEEFADCLAWLTSLASIHGVDLEKAAAAKYPGHCIRCGAVPCHCAK
jgi:NTP pyrophosphatase (non-canonical NTP hydrolase)